MNDDCLDGSSGAFSGGGFVDDDGRACLTCWMLWGKRGIGLVESTDPNYIGWKRSAANPVIRSDVDFGVSSLKGADGKPFLVGHGRRVFPDASASHIFLVAKGGKADFLAVTAWEMDATNPY